MGRRRHLRVLPQTGNAPVGEFLLLDDEAPALVPERAFQAVATRYAVKWGFQRHNLWLWFQIVASEPADAHYHGTELPFLCAMKAGRFGAHSKFVKLWSRVAGRPPRRGEPISANLLLHKLYSVRVRVVTKDSEQHPHHSVNRYSVISEILTVDVGGRA